MFPPVVSVTSPSPTLCSTLHFNALLSLNPFCLWLWKVSVNTGCDFWVGKANLGIFFPCAGYGWNHVSVKVHAKQ
ncbi:hypothetical protein FKM82_029299 [Ascaphus truei]